MSGTRRARKRQREAGDGEFIASTPQQGPAKKRARWLAKAGEGPAAAPAEAAPRAPIAAAPAAAASGGEMPLPEHFAVLQRQFQALDKALSHARRLSQRTFRALRALVEKETRRSLRIEDLGRICAVAPDFFHVTKVELDGTEHVVVEHRELGRPAAEAKEGPRRTERTVLLRPRALDFRERLAGRVREHIADVLSRMPGQLESVPAHQVRSVPPDVPLECVPDVTPVAAEWIGTRESGTGSHGPASAALKPSKAAALRAAGAGSKAAAAVPGLEGLSPALIAMVQRREAVNNRRLASVGPAASQVLQLEEMRKHLVNCVWGHRSKKQGQSGSISVPALVGELRRRMPGLAAARGAAMVERLAAEAATLAAPAEEPWCSILTADVVDGAGARAEKYLKVQHAFDARRVKEHLTAKIAELNRQGTV